ncbi:hypothetical protein RND81_11G107300 [Saponaria officinalis]|uniref:Uncharacterized protein n=1 Tax=Saponaria officinalis TaxID=3572 RepID=A0AAW1HKF6_SAPOF
MSLSPHPQSLISKNSKVVVASSAHGNKKRKKVCGKKSSKQKMEVLSEGFKPIPFVPRKSFDFSRHEEDLRKLGLWDFVHVEFDSNVRTDLLVELIAGYTAKNRGSYVNGCRVKVNRADLARALKLPVKKPSADCEWESYSGEFLPFLEELVSSWMVLQECEVWVTPTEVVNWMKMIKDGQPHKVDWAGMIWFMVEKELSQGQGLKDCYYASHLQRLMKDQREILFTKSVDLDAENQKVEEVNVEDEVDGDVKMLDAHESSFGDERLQEDRVVLELNQECVETVGASDMEEKEKCSELVQKDDDVDMVERTDDVELGEMEGEASKLKEGEASKLKEVDDDDVDKEKNEDNVGGVESFDVAKEMEENVENVERVENVEDSKGMSVDDMVDSGFEKHWPLHGMNDGHQHVMQPCSMIGGLKISVEDSTRDGGEDVEDEEGEDDKSGYKFMEETTPTMEGMAARNLMDAIETGNLSFTSPGLGGQSSLGLMPSRTENDVMLNSQSMFNHVGKREIDHDHDFSHHALGDGHKRMRIHGNWDEKPADTGTCLDEALQWMEKAKMTFEAEKYQQANMMEMYAEQVATKEAEVMQWRIKFDDLQRTSHAEIHRRDRELHLMNSVITGYRKALKDTQRAFAEYRKRCGIADESIYKDVGNGGVVKSVMELEKERIKQEEERKRICYVLEDAYHKHVFNYETLCGKLLIKVTSFDDRLTDAAKDVELLKHDFVKRKTSENAAMSEEVEGQNEAQESQKDDLVKHKISENVGVLEDAQNEAEELPKDDLVEPKMSENAETSKDVEGEVQGHSEAQGV